MVEVPDEALVHVSTSGSVQEMMFTQLRTDTGCFTVGGVAYAVPDN